jgi:hypothetical protein
MLRGVAAPSSHSSFCEEVFSLRIRETNEVDRANVLASGLSFFPPSPLTRVWQRVTQTPCKIAADDWPNGKSYPVTAAQLLPILTGFLAPIHFSKLAKNRHMD